MKEEFPHYFLFGRCGEWERKEGSEQPVGTVKKCVGGKTPNLSPPGARSPKKKGRKPSIVTWVVLMQGRASADTQLKCCARQFFERHKSCPNCAPFSSLKSGATQINTSWTTEKKCKAPEVPHAPTSSTVARFQRREGREVDRNSSQSDSLAGPEGKLEAPS